MQSTKRIFITGTNRGIGYNLVKLLHDKYPNVELHITSRRPAAEFSESLKKDFPDHKFICYQLDIQVPEHVGKCVEQIKEQKIELDAIVCNAGYGCDYGTQVPTPEIARKTLKVNVTDTIHFIHAFLPLLAPTGRVVIVSSDMGSLHTHSKKFQEIMQDPKITEERIFQLVQEYVQAAEQAAKEPDPAKRHMKYFHWSSYMTSRAFINAWSRFVFQSQLKEGQTQICIDPGWCLTDMGGNEAPLSAMQGAERINHGIWLPEVDHTRFFNEEYRDYFLCGSIDNYICPFHEE